MARRAILTLGHPMLKRHAEAVELFDAGLRELIADLFETMGDAHGIGLAAPQIDVSRRVIVVDPSPIDPEQGRPLALVNPVIVAYAGSAVFEEGCLSIPGLYTDVRRPEQVTIRYADETGIARDEVFEGIMARVIQHERDHLDGVLFPDRVSSLRRAWLLRRYASNSAGRGPQHAPAL
jgi:peptide deformylase